jgi:hypothetical protein
MVETPPTQVDGTLLEAFLLPPRAAQAKPQENLLLFALFHFFDPAHVARHMIPHPVAPQQVAVMGFDSPLGAYLTGARLGMAESHPSVRRKEVSNSSGEPMNWRRYANITLRICSFSPHGNPGDTRIFHIIRRIIPPHPGDPAS